MKYSTVFISYGHNVHDNLVYQMAKDIRARGANVFLDKDYLHIGDWEEVIDRHLKNCDLLIFIVSQRSVSKDGYCLNELCRAGELNIPIIPVSLDSSMVPLSINRLQRISMQNCELPGGQIHTENYMLALNTITAILEGNSLLEFADNDIRLKSALCPINNDFDLFSHYLDFCGREELFDKFESWLHSEEDKIFWLCANPGVGKTAFSANLCWRYPTVVGAIHFCKFNNSDRADAKRIIASIAYQLSYRLLEYKNYLLEIPDIDKIYSKNAIRLFEYLLIEPFININSSTPIVIVIDALDEATWNGNNELCSILLRDYKRLPSWLKIVVTSRNEREIRRSLMHSAYMVQVLNETNFSDIKKYYQATFPNLSESLIEMLTTKSEGSFLYTIEICKKLKENNLPLSHPDILPDGIYGFFIDSFDRLFRYVEDSDLQYESVRPLIELLTVALEDVSIEFIEEYLNWDEYHVNKVLSRLASFFPIRDAYINIIHKSIIDWLLDPTMSNEYYISKKKAYSNLLSYTQKSYISGNYEQNNYVLKHFGTILIHLNKWNELSEILDDGYLQSMRIKEMNLDSGLRAYLNEMDYLYNNRNELCLSLFSRPTFIRLFSENRRLLYNSGLFFRLRDIGFSIFLRTFSDNWELEAEIGKVFYYYITEDFKRAIRCADKLLAQNDHIKSNAAFLAEIYNVKGLSLRKQGAFNEAIETFNFAIRYAEDAENAFELSLAYLILAKINSRLLNWNDAVSNNRKAIRILKKEIDEQPKGDERTSNLLFLAEDYRVFADLLIWSADFESAMDNLELSKEIYATYNCTDRYYIRFRYTSVFWKIAVKEHCGIEEEFADIENNLMGSYDTAQVSFLHALYLYIQSDEPSELAMAEKYVCKAYDENDKIEAEIEREEAVCLFQKIQTKTKSLRKLESSISNDHTERWIKYVDGFIDQLYRRSRSNG